MTAKIQFTSQRATQGETVTGTLSWDMVKGASQYRFKVTPSDPRWLPAPSVEPVKDVVETKFSWDVPTSLADGDYTLHVAVEPDSPAGAAPPESQETKVVLRIEGWKMSHGLEADSRKALTSIASSAETLARLGISLRSTARSALTPERERLWETIKQSSEAMSFEKYRLFMDERFCEQKHALPGNMRMPFSQVDAYQRLKAFTELFLLKTVGVVGGNKPITAPLGQSGASADASDVLQAVRGARPYLSAVLSSNPDFDGDAEDICNRLRYPVLLELIWSYWHEEAMLVQSLQKLLRRFQNRSDARGRDPLVQLELDPLRPLNNILWGYAQDEQHRLSVRQRAYEYAHAYGLSLEGRAVGRIQPADTRQRFLPAFHGLLNQAVQFFRQADDTTVVANGGPLLFSLQDLHFILAEGAHNQFGDLPWNARLEMLMEQWILSRPEIQEFLRGRRGVPYPEAWMCPVDNMKSLQGWSGTSVVHFRNLGYFGEQLLLSVRDGGALGPPVQSWSSVQDPAEAAAWAVFWRPQIEGYIHAYHAATGIDLGLDPPDRSFLLERDRAPSEHLRRRLTAAVGR